MPDRVRTTRLAPSPTGALHLGNARTFLVNWLIARTRGWRIHLRIEDLDGPRIKPNADRDLVEDLRWLGIDWDECPSYQSTRHDVYKRAIHTLLALGRAYPCVCSRSEIERAASAPHAEDGSAVYPGTCRGRFASMELAAQTSGRAPAIRFAVPAGQLAFEDQILGTLHFDPQQQLGDFVIAKADGTAAYQLAVVVDDATSGVTDVVRGDDLVDSTPRQILLYQALGWADRVPRYFHLPLVLGPDGRRLAKRHGDTRLASYRSDGISASRVLQLLASWCGFAGSERVTTAANLLPNFRLSQIPRTPVLFSLEDDARLRRAE